MSWRDWLIWPDQVVLSIIVLVLIGMPFLYAARSYAHKVLRELSRLVGSQFRAGSRWLLLAARELRRRNREVVAEHGREELEQSLEREFERVEALVKRDLQGYPALQRRLSELVTQIEEEYQKTGEVPPPPPEWTRAVTEIAQIRGSGDPMVERILNDIQKSVNRMHDQAIAEFRSSVQERHQILERFKPAWRSVEEALQRVSKSLRGLEERSTAIDRQMDKYQEILNRTDKAERLLGSSAVVQFTIAAVVMLVAIGGAALNFNLIALPMSEMVGGSSYIGEFRTSDVAALVIILFETALGLFLMEFLGITHLFSRIRNMSEKLRRRLTWVSFGFLLALAGVEVALAYLRDRIAASNLALRESLVLSEAEVEVVSSWIPTAGQMLLGFVLPFALAFVAIPLEVLIHSGRTVLAAFLVMVLNVLAFLFRLVAVFFNQLSGFSTALYDALISPLLLVEQYVRGRSGPLDEASETTKPLKEPRRRAEKKPAAAKRAVAVAPEEEVV